MSRSATRIFATWPLLPCLGLGAALVFGTWPRAEGLVTPEVGGITSTKPRERYSITRNRDLRGVDFRGLTLHVNNFLQTRMAHAQFSRAKLEGSLFFQTDLRGADFSAADLLNATFQASNLRNASFRDAKFRSSTFAACSLNGADFRGADLSQTRLYLSNLDGALYDAKTQLPFPREEATRRRMKYVE